MKRLYLTEKGSQIVALKKVIKDKDSSFAPLAGHLFRTLEAFEYDKKFKDWHSVVNDGSLPFIPKEFKKTLQNTSGGTNYRAMFNEVKKAIANCDEIVIASDPDNEGASLAIEVIEACNAMDKVKGMMNMAATDPSSLAKSLKNFEANPSEINYVNMARGSEARVIFDWSFGMNLTMAATVALGKGDVIHMGGVKLPTIRMIVERDLAFEGFKQEAFYKVKGYARDKNTGLEFPIDIKYEGKDGIKDEVLANKVLKEIPSNMNISKYVETNKKSLAPKPFSLLDMAANVSATNGLTLSRSENAAQSLYDKGLISYPRTEERFYSYGEFKESRGVVSALQTQGFFKSLKALNTPLKQSYVFNDGALKGKAHGALSPTTKSCNLSSLTNDEQIVYMAIAKRYYAHFMNEYEYENISLEGEKDKYKISFTENIAINDGWKEMYPSSIDDKVRSVPEMKIGDNLEIIDVELVKDFTKPKPRFTELTLAQAMENISNHYDDLEVKEHLGGGIGTPATRNKIIQDLKESKSGFKVVEPYVIIEKGKIISTKKARDTIEILPNDITSPVLRAELEANLVKVVLGELSVPDVKKIVQKDITNMCNEIIDLGKELGIKQHNMLGFDNPTQKQLDYVLNIAKHNKLEIPKDVLEHKEKISNWMEENADKIKYPLSVKQREILEKSEDPSVQAMLGKNDFDSKEIDFLGKAVKAQIKEFKKDYRFNISDKQKELLLNPDNNVDAKVVKMINEKPEFDQKEYNKIQKEIKRVFEEFKAQRYANKGKSSYKAKPKKSNDDFGR